MTRPPTRPAVRVRALLDTGLLTLSSAAFISGFDFLELHVWLGLTLAVGVGWHLALHRSSHYGLLRRWLEPLAARVRLQALFNLLLVVDVVALASSGAIVAQIFAPAVARFHAGAAWAFIALVGLHLILNARWIGAQLRRVAARRVSPARERGLSGTGRTLS